MTFVFHALAYAALVWQGLLGAVTRVPYKPTYEEQMPFLESVEIRFMSVSSFEWTFIIQYDVRYLYVLFFLFINIIRF